MMTGFSVQVASMSITPEMPKYASLKAVGNVYSVLDKGAYKVRVGPFNTREEAMAKVSQVKRYGYSGAFVVAESGTPGTSPNVQSKPPVEPPVQDGQIMIQLGAYSNVNYFDAAKATLIGPVVDRVKGKLTIKLITGFFSLDEARRTLPTAKQAGFKDAFIVQERNGVLLRIP
jgi:cell division protein FtsN